MKEGLMDQAAGVLPPVAGSGFRPGRRINLLAFMQGAHLADRCVATLAAAGFSPAIDAAASLVDFSRSLDMKCYDLALAETATVNPCWQELSATLQGARVPVPLIMLTEHPREASRFDENALDCLSPEELYRLPRLARQALEMKALREQAADAREAQHSFEERYRLLFERNVAGVFRVSLDGRLLDLNVACARMFGYAGRDEARAHTLPEALAESDDYERLKRRLIEQKSINNFELQLRRRDGQLLWALATASLVEDAAEAAVIEGTLLDVTEWKHAAEALGQSEKRFRAMVENSTDAISLVDAQGKVLYSSHAISPIFGYSLEERKGKNIFELVHPEDVGETLPLFKKLLQSPFTSASTQIRYRHKDGTWRWIEALGTNLLEEPSVKAVVINYRDITERRQLLEQLFQAQKMEAVGRLAGGVAHDFNNLLTAILGYSDMVLEKLPPNSLLRRYTSEIKKAGERAASLTRQLLAFSRLQVMSPQSLDLNAVIADMEKMLRRVIGEDINLATVLGAAAGRIKADPSQIEQVILNLAVNARDAMPHGGDLTIKTS